MYVVINITTIKTISLICIINSILNEQQMAKTLRKTLTKKKSRVILQVKRCSKIRL